MQVQQPLANYNGKPEVDDGHTKIANELLDAIVKTDFSKRQYKILLFIIRKTYGWNKTEDDISRSQILDATGLKNPHITTTIQELLEMNVLIVSNGNHAKRYKINKYYDTWRITETVIVTKTVNITETVIVTETVTDCYQNSNISLLKQYPQKTTPKDNTKDNNIYTSDFIEFWKMYPKKTGKDAAFKIWKTKKPRLDDVLFAISWQKETKTWRDGFIKNPTTYLNQGCWKDEPPEELIGDPF